MVKKKVMKTKFVAGKPRGSKKHILKMVKSTRHKWDKVYDGITELRILIESPCGYCDLYLCLTCVLRDGTCALPNVDGVQLEDTSKLNKLRKALDLVEKYSDEISDRVVTDIEGMTIAEKGGE